MKVKLKGTLADVGLTLLSASEIKITLVDEYGNEVIGSCDGKTIIKYDLITTDAVGYFEVQVCPNSALPKPTYYKIGFKGKSEQGNTVTRYIQVHIDGTQTEADISTLLSATPIPLPPQGAVGTFILQQQADGTRTWVTLPAGNGNGNGDMTIATYDTNQDGVVDMAKSSQDVGDITTLDPLVKFNAIYQG